MYYIIDRIINNTLVCENMEDGTIHNIVCEDTSVYQEGLVIKKVDDTIIIDQERTLARKNSIASRFNNLKNNSSNK